jgi:PilZ domain
MFGHSERRTEHRARVLKEGKLLVALPCGTIDVKIRDLSESGARIELLSPSEIPHTIALISVQAGTIRRCVVAWQRCAHLGLRFVEAPRKLGIRKY